MNQLIYFLIFQQFITIWMFWYQTNSGRDRFIKHLQERLDQEIQARTVDAEKYRLLLKGYSNEPM